MKFWDSSAIVPLIISEETSPVVRKLLEKDAEMLVWIFTPTEVLSALHRKIREKILKRSELIEAQKRLKLLEQGWSEIVNVELVRQQAARLLAAHPLRAADSLQLAAALVAFEGQSQGAEFVTFDDNLAEAAHLEGFEVLPTTSR